MEQKIDPILAKYFGGEASQKDMQILDRWLAEAPENEAYFNQLTLLFEQIVLAGTSNIPKPHTEKAKENFLNYIQQERVRIKNSSTGKNRVRLWNPWQIVAASMVLICIVSGILWHNFQSKELIVSGSSDGLPVIMPDQTKVSLPEDSQITYVTGYGNKNRSIILHGKATFAVDNTTEYPTPLRVYASETIIEDIGTVFSVIAYPDSSWVYIEVEEGEVHFFTKENEGIYLSFGETATYDRNTKLFYKKIKAPSEIRIDNITEVLEFEDMPLYEVVEKLNIHFHTDIQLASSSLRNQRISITFHTADDLHFILQIIANTLDLDVDKENGKYIFSQPVF